MTLTALEEWFATFPDTITELAGVEFGDEDEILTRQNTRIRYPCMWVETPAPTFTYDPPGLQYACALTFLQNVSKPSGANERAARSAMLVLAQKAWAMLEAGEAQGLFQFERNREEGDAILRWSGDNDTGWRFVARLIVGRDDC